MDIMGTHSKTNGAEVSTKNQIFCHYQVRHLSKNDTITQTFKNHFMSNP